MNTPESRKEETPARPDKSPKSLFEIAIGVVLLAMVVLLTLLVLFVGCLSYSKGN